MFFGLKIIGIIIFSFKLEDECLIAKIAIGKFGVNKATRLFQSHSFKKSLEAYQECIDFCYKTD